MSASLDTPTIQPDDAIVTMLSAWLAFDVANSELQRRLLEIDPGGLRAEQSEAVAELLAELETAPGDTRGDLEMLVRETLEAVALG